MAILKLHVCVILLVSLLGTSSGQGKIQSWNNQAEEHLVAHNIKLLYPLPVEGERVSTPTTSTGRHTSIGQTTPRVSLNKRFH